MEFTKEELEFLSVVLGNSQVAVSKAKPVYILLEKIQAMIESLEPAPVDPIAPEEPKAEEEKPLVLD